MRFFVHLSLLYIDYKTFTHLIMIDLLKLMKQRRSTRRFEVKPVDPEKIDMLLQAALSAPSAKNTRSWEFIVVDQPDLLQALSLSREHSSSFLAQAPLAIVVAVDPEKSDAWIENASIASAFLQIQAEAMGLGSCWVQIARRTYNENLSAEEYVRNLLYIPYSMRILNIVAIGYKANTLPPHPMDETLQAKIHHNMF